jgi:hypothetical protein
MTPAPAPSCYLQVKKILQGSDRPLCRTEILGMIGRFIDIGPLNAILESLVHLGHVTEMNRDEAQERGADPFHKVPSTRYYETRRG